MIYSLSALSKSTLFFGGFVGSGGGVPLALNTSTHSSSASCARFPSGQNENRDTEFGNGALRGIGNSRIEMKTMLRYFPFTDMITRRRWMHATVCVCVCAHPCISINIRADG